MLSILAEIAASKSVSSGNFDTHRQIRESIDFVSFKKRTAPDFRQERLGIISVQLILGDGSLNILGLLTLGRGTTVSELDPVSDDLSELTTDTILLVVPGFQLAEHSDLAALRHVLRNKDGRITPAYNGRIIRLITTVIIDGKSEGTNGDRHGTVGVPELGISSESAGQKNAIHKNILLNKRQEKADRNAMKKHSILTFS